MAGRANIAEIAFEIAKRVEETRDLDTLSSLLKLATRTLGFDAFALAPASSAARGSNARLGTFLSNFPSAWQTHYIENGFSTSDPVTRALKAARRPFHWRDLERRVGEDPAAKRVMREASEFGLVDGVAVPVFGPSGLAATASFAGTRRDLSETESIALHLVAIYAASRAEEIAWMPQAPVAPQANLTPREIDCLQWSSEGKTSWEIGEILNISERTVESYLKTAAQKLSARSRTQAVAIAMKRGLVN
jgi:LuxR family quorum sensing-dependent transcriptional regulator